MNELAALRTAVAAVQAEIVRLRKKYATSLAVLSTDEFNRGAGAMQELAAAIDRYQRLEDEQHVDRKDDVRLEDRNRDDDARQEGRRDTRVPDARVEEGRSPLRDHSGEQAQGGGADQRPATRSSRSGEAASKEGHTKEGVK